MSGAQGSAPISDGGAILIIGAHGQVGRALVSRLEQSGEAQVSLTRREMDLSLLSFDESLLERAWQCARSPRALAPVPRAVVLAAAYTQVDRAQAEPEVASRVNSRAPGVIARWCAERGVPLMHFSTDYVFHGLGRDPHRESDLAKPLNLYGATKLAGEEAVASARGPHLVFRTSWIYSERGPSFLQTMLRLGREQARLAVVDDQIGAPTCAWDLAGASLQGLRAALAAPVFPSGVYHLCASGETSWRGFAQEIFRQARARGIRLRLEADDDASAVGASAGSQGVDAISSADYAARHAESAPRPLNSRLDCERAERVLGLRMAPWAEALRACFDRMELP